MSVSIKLSICIATYNRGAFIGETLDSILCQMQPEVEIIVVDGASTDNTPEIMEGYLIQSSVIRYYREQENSGVDLDYDKAVGYARGEYCWLMTDDDLLKAESIKGILSALQDDTDLVIANSEARSADLSVVLKPRLLEINDDVRFTPTGWECFFKQCANYMSFIGCVVIRRSIWMKRVKQSYYGTLFIHIGVIFQKPMVGVVKVIADPVIVIRYGNANWTSRKFEIWMFKWPELLWSFGSVSVSTKHAVCALNLINSPKYLFYQRAVGGYSWKIFKKYILVQRNKKIVIPFILVAIPAWFANLVMLVYFFMFKPMELMKIYDLLRCRASDKLTCRIIERLFIQNSFGHCTRLSNG